MASKLERLIRQQPRQPGSQAQAARQSSEVKSQERPIVPRRRKRGLRRLERTA